VFSSGQTSLRRTRKAALKRKKVPPHSFSPDHFWAPKQELPERLPELHRQPHLTHDEQCERGWNENDASANIIVIDNGLTLHRHPVAQSTDAIRGKMSYERGLHAIEFTWEHGQRGTHAVIGLCTDKMILERPGYCSLIGADDQGWGWDLTRNRLFHGGGMVRVGSNVPIKNERENGSHTKPSDVCKKCAKKDKKTQHSAKQCHVDVYDEDDNNCFYPCPHEEYQIPARVVMILDCDNGLFGGHKCKGGSMAQAFGWVKSNGLCSEADDAYKCADQASTECTSSTCSISSASCTKVLKAGDVTGYTSVSQTENALEAAVTQQPVSIAIEADQQVFQHYTGGVLTSEACGETLDHGVLIVGYGTDNGQKYWKVKNSWGNGWGEGGYVRIERGTKGAGQCGINSMASYPIVKKTRPGELIEV